MPRDPSDLRRFFEYEDCFNSALFQVASWALLGSCVIIQIVSSIAVSTGSFDDSVPLVGADLVRRGRVPQIDFMDVYPPLLNYLLAGAFHLFGRTALVHKALSASLYLVVIAAIARFFWVRAACLRPLVPFMVLPVALAIGSSISDASCPASALGLLALVTYAGSLDRRQAGIGIRWALVVAGSLAGMAALFRVNFGLYTLAVMGIDVLVSEKFTCESTTIKARLRRILSQLITLAIPFILLNAVVYTGIYGRSSVFAVLRMVGAARAAIGYRFQDLPLTAPTMGFVVWPCVWVFLRIIFTADRLPGRALAALCPVPLLVGVVVAGRQTPSVAIWLPALGILVVLVLYSRVLHFTRAEFCLLLYFVCTLHYYLSRADSYHTDPVLPALVLVVPFLVLPDSEGRGVAFSQRGLSFAVLIGAIWMVGCSGRPTLHVSLFVRGIRSVTSGGLRLPMSDAEQLPTGNRESPWILSYADAVSAEEVDELKVVEFIRTQTDPGDPIFVGVRDHSRIFANDVRIYWLANRVPGCRYVQLDAGVASRADVQRQIISDLQRNAVKLAVLQDFRWADDTFRRHVNPDSRVLDDFFAATFREVARFGTFSVVERKE